MAVTLYDVNMPGAGPKDLTDIGTLDVYTMKVDWSGGFGLVTKEPINMVECSEEYVSAFTTLPAKGTWEGWLCVAEG